MTDETDKTFRLKRILVALDTSRHSRAALEAAVRLARAMEAEIQGLFVYDRTWLRASKLPSFAEVREFTGEIRPMAEKEMEKQVALLEKRLQRLLRETSERFDISHFLESAEGNIEEKILEASEHADLITLGRIGHSYSRTKKLGETARSIIIQSEKPVLILQEGLRVGNSVAVVYDGSRASRRGLNLGLALARKNEGSLFLHVFRNHPEALDERMEEIETLMDESPVPVYLNLIERPEIGSFARQVNSTRSGLIIMPKKQPLIGRNSIGTLLDYLHCPLLLVSED